MLVHGWACERNQFSELISLLRSDFRILSLDLPGHGTNPLGDFVPSLEGYARWLGQFLDHHRVAEPILVGHSMGGVISLTAAGDHRVKAGAVINLDGSLPPTVDVLAGKERLKEIPQATNFRPQLEALLREAFFLPHERGPRQVEIVSSMCHSPPAVLRFLPRAIEELSPEEVLSQIRAPVFYVGAERPRFDEPVARRLCGRATFSQIRNTGHFLHVYAPHEVKQQIKAFITRLSSPTD